jgi:hypothetical protein
MVMSQQKGAALFGLFTCIVSFGLLFSYLEAATTGALLPSGDGTYAAWTPSTGSTHYTLVDETTCNGVTDYVSTLTVGNRDSFAVSLAAVPNGATITQISLTPCASRASTGGGGSATLNVFYRSNGVNSADQGSYSLTGTTPTGLAATNFSGLGITKTATSTLEAGVVYSAGTKGARVSRLATVITYTPAAPAVTTSAATSIGTTTATLNGSANPNGATSTGWFRYATTNPGTCDDTFGTRAPSSGGTALGSGTTSVNFNRAVSGLSVNTTYYFCALASNAGGTSTGSVLSFTTADVAPSAPSGLSATPISSSQIDLAWTDNSGNELGFKVERSTAGAGGPWTQIATTSANATSYSNTGLSLVTSYWYRVRAYNAVGNSAYTAVATTKTLAEVPVVTTGTYNLFATTSPMFASLFATANPQGATTTGWFRYSDTNPGTCDDTFGVRTPTSGGSALGTGTSSVFYNASTFDLASSTTYYYCAIASNSIGTGFGALQSFVTP